MWTRELLKENGKIAFKRNYWSCVLISLILSFFIDTASGSFKEETDINMSLRHIPDFVWFLLVIAAIMAICCGILIANVIQVGGKRYYLENREHKTPVSRILWGFQEGRYGNNVWIMFLMNLYLIGWWLLFAIPGIIKSYSYRLIPYILADNPKISKDRAFAISRQAMNGHKLEAFVLDLSFIGWHILKMITFGIVGIFYVNPYVDATNAEFYSAIKAEAIQKGITDTRELPGFGEPMFEQDSTEEFTEHTDPFTQEF